LFARLSDRYEQFYYKGLLQERRAKAQSVPANCRTPFCRY